MIGYLFIVEKMFIYKCTEIQQFIYNKIWNLKMTLSLHTMTSAWRNRMVPKNDDVISEKDPDWLLS